VSELPRRDDEAGSRAVGALIRRLEISWPKGARRLAVLLLADCDADDQVLPVNPLEHWLAGRAFRFAGHPHPLYRTERLGGPELRRLNEQPALETGFLGRHHG
jgi:hypothetical protein